MGSITEVFGAVNVETPPFVLLHKDADYEIRRFPKLVVIKTPSGGRDSYGFQALANFIFGGNQDTSQGPPKPIAMTAPVVSSGNEMSFILPKVGFGINTLCVLQKIMPNELIDCWKEYDAVDKVPKPKSSSRVRVEEQEEHDMAILTYRGDGWSQYDAKLAQLKVCLKRDGVAFLESSAVLNQFNPPWTLPFLRTNEVGLRLVSRFLGKL